MLQRSEQRLRVSAWTLSLHYRHVSRDNMAQENKRGVREGERGMELNQEVNVVMKLAKAGSSLQYPAYS